MRWFTKSLGAVTAAAACCALAPSHGTATSLARTAITVDGRRLGLAFDGVGAISGGGGVARLLIDYPPAQRTQILNYLFGPGGASLQVLKLEIGGDAAASDGAEPSVESSQGQIDCKSGYTWWLAEQAVARDPEIRLVGLQWSAPGWIGPTIWDQADVGYVIDWLNCAKSHGLRISYLGGWNEHGYNVAWYEALRKALDAHGYGAVKIMAADTFPGRSYDWAKTWRVAKAAAADPAFKAALGAIAAHDTCGGPTRGYLCQSTPAARRLGLPLWESELGSLHGDPAAASMARTINNGYIQARVTGFLEWPMVSSMPPGLLYSGRGLVVASQPQSGYYYVARMAWAIAQTTQFTKVGWRHGASGDIGDSGTYNAYVSGRDWSLVTENAGSHARQRIGPQTITVRLTGGLKTGTVSVWSTDLESAQPSRWFVRQPSIHPVGGAFSYKIPAGYAVSFTSTTGQSHLRYSAPGYAPMRLPYSATPDLSNEAWGLATQEGAFVYQPCLAGAAGAGGLCLQQMAGQVPVWWQQPQHGIPDPYAVVGAPQWANYSVRAHVLVPTPLDFAGVIGRFGHQGGDNPSHFEGYELQLRGDGRWHLLVNSASPHPLVLASGTAAVFTPDGWNVVELSMSGDQIDAVINGKVVARKVSSTYTAGLAGIESSWAPAQFTELKVTSGTVPPGGASK